jgi:hypothetical protein
MKFISIQSSLKQKQIDIRNEYIWTFYPDILINDSRYKSGDRWWWHSG